MKHKIQALLSEMNTGLIDREHALKAALLTVLAAENLVLIGPPGTAKSMVSRRVAQHIQTTTNGSHQPDDGSGSYFEYLLTKFSTPEEIFGPLSISELKADRFRRNTAGYLPTAEIAFLDEIFKSSSSILNSLLTILNERIFHNGNQPQHVPLRSLISASNELPSGQEELSALYDRFLMRTFVGPVREEHLHRLFDAPGAVHQPTLQLTAQDFQAVDAAAQQVRMPPEVGEAIRGIWAAHKEAFKEDRREYLSDRRLVKLLKLLRVSAATNHRTEVDLSDAMLLQHCLWNHPDNMDKVREIVITTLKRHSVMVPVDGEDVSKPDGVDWPGDEHSIPRKPFVNIPTKTRTKGFMGSGTAQDPIRIGNADDLISLDDPDIGLAGYHFVQTYDIDCAAISHWPSFAFKGHYDGNGKAIRNIKGTSFSIFSALQGASSVSHLRLESCSLATEAAGSRIEHCHATEANLLGSTSDRTQLLDCHVSGGFMVGGEIKDTQISGCKVTDGVLVGGNAESAKIIHCEVKGGDLVSGNVNETQIMGCQVTAGFGVGGNANNAKITHCQVIDGNALVLLDASNTHISNCVVVMNWRMKDKHSSLTENLGGFGSVIAMSMSPYKRGLQCIGGISGKVINSSTIEQCFVAGSFSKFKDKSYYFGAITGSCEYGTIRQCGVGSLTLKLTSASQRKRIVGELTSATLDNNASIDTNPGQDDPNGVDGKTVAAVRFNQRYVEGSLGWDFDTVWQWDAANNRPTLRFGANASQAADPAASNTTTANGTPLQDLLTRQVQANIWL